MENVAPKFTKRGSGLGGGLAVKPSGMSVNVAKATAIRAKSVRPALGDISNRSGVSKKQDDMMPKKKRVVEDNTAPEEETPVEETPEENVDMKADETSELEDSVADLRLSAVDAGDTDNPQAVSEYIMDIMAHLKDVEAGKVASPTYMSKQTDINSKMREILIDWLIEVHVKFKLRPETLYLTVNIIDRFLERRAVSRTKLQLVGCTAMLIASKYEEIYAPEVRDFVYISDQAYTRDQILAMESIVLNTLAFYLTVPTTLRFGERLMKVSGTTDEGSHLIRFFMELTLQEYKFLKYLPSEIAASAAYLALKMTGQTWDSNMISHSGYDVESLRACITDLHQLAIKDSPKYRAVRKKYLNKKFDEVSQLPVPEPF